MGLRSFLLSLLHRVAIRACKAFHVEPIVRLDRSSNPASPGTPFIQRSFQSVNPPLSARSFGALPFSFVYFPKGPDLQRSMAGYDDQAEALYYIDDTAGSFDQDLVYALDAGVRHSVNQALAQAIQPFKHHLLGLVDQPAWIAPVSAPSLGDPSFAASPQPAKQPSNPHAADFQSLIRNMAREHDYNAGSQKKAVDDPASSSSSSSSDHSSEQEDAPPRKRKKKAHHQEVPSPKDLVYALDAGVRHSVNQALAQAIQPIKHHLLGLVDQPAWTAPVSAPSLGDPCPLPAIQPSNLHAADFQSLIRNMAREHDYNAGSQKKAVDDPASSSSDHSFEQEDAPPRKRKKKAHHQEVPTPKGDHEEEAGDFIPGNDTIPELFDAPIVRAVTSALSTFGKPLIMWVAALQYPLRWKEDQDPPHGTDEALRAK
ncbi:hypothetical protein NDU88_006503 [Pleurodeles waltl]|uniref:Uncharacterized protein n=1 Tax=Pleurodeles waltl TaxID=8319 RepID=A0AAV7RQF1_PLEWA|nr:hypothetical protein NDU88_006503 [Pleurodeles waltl]